MKKQYMLDYESGISKEQDLTFNDATDILLYRGIKLTRELMKKMNLIAREGYTNLGLLISDQCQFGIVISVFEDENHNGAISKCEINGSILKHIEQAIDFIERFDPKSDTYTNYLNSKPMYTFPMIAIEEAIKNTVVHRDYSITGMTTVNITNRKITINSLGGLNQQLGLEDITMGITSPRNPKLMTMMRQFHFVTYFGHGIPSIMKAYERTPFDPGFRTTENVFSVCLPIIDEREKITPEEKIIMVLFSNSDVIMRCDAEKHLGVSKSKATKILNELAKQGIINIEGTGKSTRYVLAKR